MVRRRIKVNFSLSVDPVVRELVMERFQGRISKMTEQFYRSLLEVNEADQMSAESEEDLLLKAQQLKAESDLIVRRVAERKRQYEDTQNNNELDYAVKYKKAWKLNDMDNLDRN